MMGPFELNLLLGKGGAYLISLLIGIGFGFALEMGGFGNSRKLAAMFYFKDMTVLKVMFTGIVVAMVLIFWASGLRLLDFARVWVNPTYLWPGLVGGLIMGVGFIIGGFCPGTSLVAAGTLKIDGVFYLLGVLFGVFLFGETVGLFDRFWTSSHHGQLTLHEWMGLPAGVVVALIVAMALFMFWGSEQLERIFGGRDLKREPRLRIVGAGLLLAAGIALIPLGQPTPMEKYELMANEKEPLIEQGLVQIHPGELLDLMYDDMIKLVMLDLREERNYRQFHLRGARLVDPKDLETLARELERGPAVAVHVLIDNDETLALQSWRELQALRVQNVYVLEGGVKRWLDIFNDEQEGREARAHYAGDGDLRRLFGTARGDELPASYPEKGARNLVYTGKVKLEVKKQARSGGCRG